MHVNIYIYTQHKSNVGIFFKLKGKAESQIKRLAGLTLNMLKDLR